MEKSYYDMLGISQKASAEEIKKAYKQLAMKHHPDKNPSDRQKAKQTFTKISEAYQVLSDPHKRQAYDREKHQEVHSQSSKRSGNNYRWKNPEFDPSYDHFANLPKIFNKNTKTIEMPDFKMPIFDTSKWFRQQFGTFTFQMAEQVFQSVFQNFDKNLKQLKGNSSNLNAIRDSQKSSSSEQKLIGTQHQGFKSLNSYCPKNGVLIEEKTIERNGKQILVKKFNVTDEKGVSHKQIREIFLNSS